MEVSLNGTMTRSLPICDRHPNLQMVPCWLKRHRGITGGHVCPVPGCGRYHVDDVYVEADAVEVVLGPTAVVPSTGLLKKPPQKNLASDKRPLNRHAAARAAILKAIEQKQHQ